MNPKSPHRSEHLVDEQSPPVSSGPPADTSISDARSSEHPERTTPAISPDPIDEVAPCLTLDTVAPPRRRVRVLVPLLIVTILGCAAALWLPQPRLLALIVASVGALFLLLHVFLTSTREPTAGFSVGRYAQLLIDKTGGALLAAGLGGLLVTTLVSPSPAQRPSPPLITGGVISEETLKGLWASLDSHRGSVVRLDVLLPLGTVIDNIDAERIQYPDGVVYRFKKTMGRFSGYDRRTDQPIDTDAMQLYFVGAPLPSLVEEPALGLETPPGAADHFSIRYNRLTGQVRINELYNFSNDKSIELGMHPLQLSADGLP